jgi:hypothetical protein
LAFREFAAAAATLEPIDPMVGGPTGAQPAWSSRSIR